MLQHRQSGEAFINNDNINVINSVNNMLNCSQETHKRKKDEKLISKNNRQKMQTHINPYCKNMMTAHE